MRLLLLPLAAVAFASTILGVAAVGCDDSSYHQLPVYDGAMGEVYVPPDAPVKSANEAGEGGDASDAATDATDATTDGAHDSSTDAAADVESDASDAAVD